MAIKMWTERFVDRVLTGHAISDDRQHIVFTFAEGPPVTCSTEADCCSYTWIESVDDPAALEGRVLEVEEIEMPQPEEDLPSVHEKGPFDCLAYYGLKITTEKGRAVIDYRNDSNGYYGGSLEIE